MKFQRSFQRRRRYSAFETKLSRNPQRSMTRKGYIKKFTMHSEDRSALWKILKKLRFFLSSLIRPFQPISLLQQTCFSFTQNLLFGSLDYLSLRFSGKLSGVVSEESVPRYPLTKVICLFHFIFKNNCEKAPMYSQTEC